ncbi:hypothetical protein CYLTODRAFT_272718 [Cylindrobasidium torrendii FP15055 ss-10]|uniref:Uncharacterized protein n=1 Tax=Cylindrobasidium torrendii FP15055 ss-10 TaxID=1314674 RepID=A0A0D7BD35_9AGAR|nr:hypothetical protein CYLTODRAFT_272718 [Cylindrobasidium torrendii FP15055 ss-10]
MVIQTVVHIRRLHFSHRLNCLCSHSLTRAIKRARVSMPSAVAALDKHPMRPLNPGVARISHIHITQGRDQKGHKSKALRIGHCQIRIHIQDTTTSLNNVLWDRVDRPFSLGRHMLPIRDQEHLAPHQAVLSHTHSRTTLPNAPHLRTFPLRITQHHQVMEWGNSRRELGKSLDLKDALNPSWSTQILPRTFRIRKRLRQTLKTGSGRLRTLRQSHCGRRKQKHVNRQRTSDLILNKILTRNLQCQPMEHHC